MSKIASTSRAWSAFAVVAFSTFGCGGRTMDDPGATTDGTDDPANPTPVPTCSEICRNAIDRCLSGANSTKCASECEMMRTQFKGCKELDPFLRCMPKVPVICTPPDKVEFNGCNDERDDLSRCRR